MRATGARIHPLLPGAEPMRKLKLDLTDLEVTSFEARAETAERGTVAGHKLPPPSEIDATCGQYTCDQGANTCEYQTCYNSCYGTCAGGVCGTWPQTGCAQCWYD
jgi:hypothetical protein